SSAWSTSPRSWRARSSTSAGSSGSPRSPSGTGSMTASRGGSAYGASRVRATSSVRAGPLSLPPRPGALGGRGRVLLLRGGARRLRRPRRGASGRRGRGHLSPLLRARHGRGRGRARLRRRAGAPGDGRGLVDGVRGRAGTRARGHPVGGPGGAPPRPAPAGRPPRPRRGALGRPGVSARASHRRRAERRRPAGRPGRALRGRAPAVMAAPYRGALARVGCADGVLAEAAADLSRAHMALVAAATVLPPAHGELLAALRPRYRLGVVTNFDDTATGYDILVRHGIAPWLDTVVI